VSDGRPFDAVHTQQSAQFVSVDILGSTPKQALDQRQWPSAPGRFHVQNQHGSTGSQHPRDFRCYLPLILEMVKCIATENTIE
jgi:hypothetical protein